MTNIYGFSLYNNPDKTTHLRDKDTKVQKCSSA